MKSNDFLDKKNNLRILLRVFLGCLVLLVLVDFFVARHGSHIWETIPAFFALYGFVACSLIVLIAKKLRRFLKRPETYYD